MKGVITAFALLAAASPVWAQAAYMQSLLSIPMTDGAGARHTLAGRLCLPQGTSARSRVALLNHLSAIEPAKMEAESCDSEQAQWFLPRGFAVAFVPRRGYGASGGSVVEDRARATSRPNYVRHGLESARDIEAAVAFLAALPQIRPDGMVMQGVSAGGWATIVFGALKDLRVVALMNFAGGRGRGDPAPVAEAAGVYARNTATPMLWVYAANDLYFSPTFAAALYKSYTRNGGKADYRALLAFGETRNDGHNFWNRKGASPVWGSVVEYYLKARGALEADGRAAP